MFDPRDAEDAHRNMDHSRFLGRRIEVEFTRGVRKTPAEMRGRDRRTESNYRRRSRSPSFSPRRGSRRSRSISRGSEGFRRDYRDFSVSSSAQADDKVASRISKASRAFGGLQNTVWNRYGLQISTKVKVYKAVILLTLLYGAETWTVYMKQARRLNHSHLNCLHRILKPRWQEGTPDADVLEGTRILSIYVVRRQMQLRWSGHLVRMDERLPKRLFYGDVATGSRR
ncbi:hypothetical protein SprV_0301216300 [Sparganum proliferum]